MAVNIGDRFDSFVVTKTAKDLITRWSVYHSMCNYARLIDGEEQKMLDACLDDEYNEIQESDEMMGVGLYYYNLALKKERARA